MTNYHYEWWTVDVVETSGRYTWEIKGKTKDSVIRQIKAQVKKQNRKADDETLHVLFRPGKVLEVLWDTLELDRVGYQRIG